MTLASMELPIGLQAGLQDEQFRLTTQLKPVGQRTNWIK